MVRHLGWDGLGGATLEAVGREHRISRQRALAIVLRVRRRYQRVQVRPPRLEACLRLATPVWVEHASKAEGRLRQSGETASPFRLEGLRTAAETFHLDAPFEVLLLGGNRVAVRRGAKAPFLALLSRLKEAGRKRGVASIQAIADSLQGAFTAEDLAALIARDGATAREISGSRRACAPRARLRL